MYSHKDLYHCLSFIVLVIQIKLLYFIRRHGDTCDCLKYVGLYGVGIGRIYLLGVQCLLKAQLHIQRYVRNTRFKNWLAHHTQEFCLLGFLLLQLAYAWMTKEASWNHVKQLRCTFIDSFFLYRLADVLPTVAVLLTVCLLCITFLPVIWVKTLTHSLTRTRLLSTWYSCWCLICGQGSEQWHVQIFIWGGGVVPMVISLGHWSSLVSDIWNCSVLFFWIRPIWWPHRHVSTVRMTLDSFGCGPVTVTSHNHRWRACMKPPTWHTVIMHRHAVVCRTCVYIICYYTNRSLFCQPHRRLLIYIKPLD